jgi:hypothetical protein
MIPPRELGPPFSNQLAPHSRPLQKAHQHGKDAAGAIEVGSVSPVGVVFSIVARGFGFGLIGDAVYIVDRKSKEVNLPADAIIRVRMDDTITLQRLAAEWGRTIRQGRGGIISRWEALHRRRR